MDDQRWEEINRERGLLIEKSVMKTATDKELRRLEELQRLADEHLAPFDEARLKALEELIRQVPS